MPATAAAAREAPLPAPAARALLAFALLGAGVILDEDIQLSIGLALVLAALVVAWRAAVPGTAQPARSTAHVALAVLSGAGALGQVPSQSTPYEWAARGVSLGGVLLLAVHAAGTPRQRRLAFGALLASALALLVLTPLAESAPGIDVWQLYQHGLDNLLSGRNPYTTAVPDVYGGRLDFGYVNPYFNYPPLTLLLALPGYLALGDYRYTMVGCVLLLVALVDAIARRLRLDPRARELMVLAVALQPATRQVIAKGWNEPLLELALGGFVLLQLWAPGRTAQAAAFFAVPMMKQYFAAPVLLYLALRPRLGAVVAGLAIAAAAALPFALWDARALLDWGVLFQLRATAFRPDSLSVSALLHGLFGLTVGKGVTLGAQLAAAAIAFALWRGRGLGGFLLSSALALLTSFLVGSQAFVNYYHLVGTLLILAAVVLAAEAGGAGARP